MKSRIVASTVLAAMALFPLASSASLVGDNVGCTFGPGQTTCSPGGAIVGSGVEFGLFLGGLGGDRLFGVDLGATSATVTLVDSSGLGFAFGGDKLVLSDLDFAGFPGGITGLNVDLGATGGLMGFTASDFTFTADSLTVNFSGTFYSAGSTGSFTVNFLTDAQAVPEPSALALTGLALTGLFAMRRRKSASLR